MDNFIKIDRKIIKWEWWSDINTFRLFMYMLISAYWKDGNYKGKTIPRGAFPSSIAELSRETNLTENEIRTALKHLQSTGEITSQSTNRFTVFSIKNYDLYQTNHKQDYKQITNKSQTINEPLTNSILKEDKNGKNVEKDITYVISKKKNASAFTPPTTDEVRAYCIERSNRVDAESFVSFYESKGWMIGKNKMKDWKAAVRTWERKDKELSAPKKNSFTNYSGQSNYDFSMIEEQLGG